MIRIFCKKKLYILRGSGELSPTLLNNDRNLCIVAFTQGKTYYVAQYLENSDSIENELIRNLCSELTIDEIKEKCVFFFNTAGEFVARCTVAKYKEIENNHFRRDLKNEDKTDVIKKIIINNELLKGIILENSRQLDFEKIHCNLCKTTFFDYYGNEIRIGDYIESYGGNNKFLYMGIGFYSLNYHFIITNLEWFCFQRYKGGVRLFWWQKIGNCAVDKFKYFLNKAIIENSRPSLWINKMIYSRPQKLQVALQRREFYPKTIKLDFTLNNKIDCDSDLRKRNLN